MAPEIALDAIPEKGRKKALTVLDPMCGSGTVLAVALQRGHNAVGVDIDPLAVMMSRLAVTDIEVDALRLSGSAVVTTARDLAGSAPWGDDKETAKFVRYWFGRSQRQQLMRLTCAIGQIANEDHKLALQLAVSRLIVTKSPQASLAADTAHSRPHRVATSSKYDVFDGFAKSVEQLTRMLDKRVLAGSGRVALGDARKLATVPACSIDLAVTSPPYLNALDYLRGHKLALVWFGYTIAELRERRSISIGAERSLDGDASKSVETIVDLIESGVVNKEHLKRPMVERFANDCLGFAAELHRVVKPAGCAVLVVGNSTLRGNYIRNDLIARKAMESAGFKYVSHREREIPPNSRYMAISAKDEASSITKRMRSEVVLTMVR